MRPCTARSLDRRRGPHSLAPCHAWAAGRENSVLSARPTQIFPWPGAGNRDVDERKRSSPSTRPYGRRNHPPDGRPATPACPAALVRTRSICWGKTVTDAAAYSSGGGKSCRNGVADSDDQSGGRADFRGACAPSITRAARTQAYYAAEVRLRPDPLQPQKQESDSACAPSRSPFGDLELDMAARSVKRVDEELKLTSAFGRSQRDRSCRGTVSAHTRVAYFE